MKIELKIHPGKVYRVHEKEYEDLKRMGLIAGVVEEEVGIDELDVDNAVDNLPEDVVETLPKRRTYKRKASSDTNPE